MNQRRKKFGVILIAGILCFLLTAGYLPASEKTGNLVFDAMEKMEKSHQAYSADVKGIKNRRAAAVAQKNATKESYRKAKPGSIDQREFHARFCLEEANVLSAFRDETDLTRQLAANQLRILKTLYQSIESGRQTVTSQDIQAMLKVSKPALNDGRILLASLGNYAEKITDPVIHGRLSAAASTAKMWSNSTAKMERGFGGSRATHDDLKMQVGLLIQEFNAIYSQTSILGSMIRDKAYFIKMVNELAAADAIFLILSNGKGIVSNLSEGVMAPLIKAVDETDQDLTFLMEGVYHDDIPETGAGTKPRWLEGY